MSTAWLKDLEERVHQATKRLGAQTKEKAKLEKKVKALEARVASLKSDLAEARSASRAATAEPAAWSEEREDIKTRVVALVAHLDGLLED